ncbi:MAG TPA: chemotaxis protein CheB, partial [Gammaproteobacteria bacterium]|nr:chemotaxis protein CheB [Gammaproteobacteria bacterium]
MNDDAPQSEAETDQCSAQAADKPRAAGDAFPIVGVGASAGGLEALKTFLDHMPADSRMAFVLVVHLSPDHKSHMAELLSRSTDMPVTKAEDAVLVEPNHVYVIPPNATLTIRDRTLRLTKAQPRPQRLPIDNFFCSLAEDQGRFAICIVLSGTGSDGTEGLIAIKQHGGMAMTQDEESAAYGEMPHSARATGQGDYVLPVEEMPARLLEYIEHLADIDGEEVATGLAQGGCDQLRRILALLRSSTGYEFSQYKESTIIRRIERRMQVTRSASPQDYLEYLRGSSAELKLLFNDMLIGVTQFMRDTAVFERLASAIVPEICAGKDDDDKVRIWAPGCSSGEEAYSIGMLFLEELQRSACNARPMIFATDIDEKALEAGRAGVYPELISNYVSPERLKQFFRKHDYGYRVAKCLRETCTFSKHNLIKDPPFSRLDMISCRNLLIYLAPALQKQVIPIFHYALRPNGILLLGPSETVTGFEELFETEDRKQCIYRRKETAVAPRHKFPMGHYSKLL